MQPAFFCPTDRVRRQWSISQLTRTAFLGCTQGIYFGPWGIATESQTWPQKLLLEIKERDTRATNKIEEREPIKLFFTPDMHGQLNPSLSEEQQSLWDARRIIDQVGTKKEVKESTSFFFIIRLERKSTESNFPFGR